jgi:fido (protein-threonine AMPylation protein)
VILFDLVGDNEQHPAYQDLTIENGNRQYDFLRSIVGASLAVGRPFLSSHVLKALNFQAIACLHAYSGEYRPCQVTVGGHTPPPHYRVQALMDDFVNSVNRNWESADPVALAAFVLWRLNWIHPFINGNGRTARAACYFVLCVKAQQWLPGTTILPELIRREHARYEQGLQHADASAGAGALDLSLLHALLAELLGEQINGASSAGGDVAVTTPPAEQ